MVKQIFNKGQCVEGFIIEEVIDASTTVQTYKASHEDLIGRPYLILCTDGRSSAVREAFKDRAVRLYTLRHLLLPPLAAGGVGERALWVATIEPRGQTLFQHIRNSDRHISLMSVAQLGVSVAEALAFARDAGLSHRRLTPHNIVLAAGDKLEVRRIFGVGFRDLFGDAFEERSSDLYKAPEEKHRFGAKDRSAERSDIYSLGMILYEIIATTLPLAGTDRSLALAAELRAVARGAAPRQLFAEALVPLPHFVDDLLGAMLARSPADRIGTWEEVIACIGALTPKIEEWYRSCVEVSMTGPRALGAIAKAIHEEPAQPMKSGRKLLSSLSARLAGRGGKVERRPDVTIDDIEVDGTTSEAPWGDEGDSI